jgi:uncharacterized protein (TIGR03437 family)
LRSQTTILEDVHAFSNFPGTNTFFGWKFTTPHGTWNNIQIAPLAHIGLVPMAATGTAYLLSQPFVGKPQDLSTSAPGFIATSTGVSGGYYTFAPGLTLQPNTVYYVFPDEGFDDAGNDTSGSLTVYITGNVSVDYGNFPGYPTYRLRGDAVYSVPTFSQSFGAGSISANGSTTLSFTVTNPNSGTGLTGVAFTDTLPSGLIVSSPNGLTGSCGSGSISAVAGSGTISLTGGTISASGSCTFSVSVAGTTVGVKNNTASAIQSNEAGDGSTASASLTVNALDQTITFGPLSDKTYGAAAFTLSASASSTLTVSFVSTTTSVCTVSGSTLTIVKAGSCSITASQGGNAIYNPAMNVIQGFTVNKAALTVTANAATIAYGSATPSFTAGITGFVNGDPSSVVGGGPSFTTNATLTNGKPDAGSWTITPAAGTLTATNYTFPTFNTGAFTVSKAALTVTASNQTINYGAAFPTFTATITGFINGDTTSAVSGTAGFTTNATTTNGSPNAGSWTITPAAGSLTATNYSFSTFNTGTLTVNKVSLTLTANNQTINYGAAFPTFTATITGFINGDTTSAVSGTAGFTTNATTTNGIPNAGSWTITPAAGSLTATNYSFLTFNTGALTVNKASLTVTANNASKVYGAPLPTFTAAITGYVNGDGAGAVSGAAGLSTAATASSPVGGYSITAVTGTLAAANYSFAFVNGTLSVAKAGTTTSLISAGGTLTATVTVLSPGAGTPTGTVQFLNGAAVAGTAGLTGSTATLAASPGAYTAAYGGDSNFASSSSGFASIYPPATSSLTLSSSVNPSKLGESVTFTAAVATGGGAPGAPAPIGAVQFLDGGKLLGSGSVSGGQASLTTSALTGGPHLIIAQYAGDSNWPSAQSTYAQNVSASVTVTLSASPAVPVYGQTVTLTANVAATVPAGFAAPTGQVTFTLPATSPFAPPVVLGTATLSAGSASLGVNTLAVGSETITAQYSGDSTWSSGSGSAAVTVAQASTASSVTLTMVGGQPTLTGAAAPVAPGAGKPTGTIQFVDQSTHAVVATATLAGGKGSATIAASALATVAGRPIAAVYSGDANFQGSTSAALPAVMSAAANLPGGFAANEIVSLFGVNGLSGDLSGTPPLPTSLGGVTVKVTDSAGVTREALLYGVFASSGQINFIVPAGTAAGPATVTVELPGGGSITSMIEITGSAPGIFTSSMTGTGGFAGQVLYGHADGSQTVANPADPVSVGAPGDQVFLVLYGTGIRGAGSVTATVNGLSVPVAYSGAQGGYDGLDQINVGPLPPSLAGAGAVSVVIVADGQTANAVTVMIQ